jgi:hypothetical protein
MKNKGISTIEIIIIIAVAAVLIVVTLVSLNIMNKKIRDTKRLNDMESLSRVFKLINEEYGDYAKACGGEFAGQVKQCVGAGENFLLNDQLPNIIDAADPLEQTIACDAECANAPCDYDLTVAKDEFTVKFFLEYDTNGYAKGCHTLNSQGIK